ncbi:MAG: DUF721 domain-containing protein [Bacteroidia bacterium]|nr:DUF721 domain-containing protein [Bacteroidia bacterium]
MSKPYQSLGDAIKSFLEIHGLDEEAAIQQVIANWESLMGKPIAQVTEKIWFKGGIFFVRIASPVWKSELQLSREKIRTMLNEQMGKEIVREVRLV